MQSAVDNLQVVKNGFVAQPIRDGMQWAVGAIQPQTDDTQAHRALIEAVLDSLTKVTNDQAAYSACTDGRLPVRLLSGDTVPVREQMVGADMVSAFYVAESLGDRFYHDPAAPVADRVHEVAEFLKENGVMPSSHVGCGAAAGFVTVTENAAMFAADAAFTARQQALLPDGIYDETLHARMLAENTKRLARNAYEGLSADVFLQAVEAVSGKQAIAELKDDGRGVHGHVEEAIIRVRVPGYAVNEARVAEVTNGREVFGVNDVRMERIARLFGRGTDEDYRIAYMALEDFADCGHGTLAKDLPTYVVTRQS
jgi:hypothetical protein